MAVASGKISVQVLKDQQHVDPEKKNRAHWKAQCLLGIVPQSFFRQKYLAIHGLALEYVSGQKPRIWLGGTIERIRRGKKRQEIKSLFFIDGNCSLMLQYKISDLLFKKEWNGEK